MIKKVGYQIVVGLSSQFFQLQPLLTHSLKSISEQFWILIVTLHHYFSGTSFPIHSEIYPLLCSMLLIPISVVTLNHTVVQLYSCLLVPYVQMIMSSLWFCFCPNERKVGKARDLCLLGRPENQGAGVQNTATGPSQLNGSY